MGCGPKGGGMSIIFVLLGLIWAGIGVANVFMGASNGLSTNVLSMSIIFNGIVFVFPGLVLLGIGAMIESKKKA
jgi:hypothetical protein